MVNFDDIDVAIIRILCNDGRASFSDIAKAVGVSIGTVRNRINHMRSSQALHFNVWLDPRRCGLGVTATLLLKVQAGQLEKVIESLIAINEVGRVATVLGDHDAQVDAFCRDITHLTQLHRTVQKVEGVTDVRTHVITSVNYDSTINLLGIINATEED